jgi:hypothetical protein
LLEKNGNLGGLFSQGNIQRQRVFPSIAIWRSTHIDWHDRERGEVSAD